MREVNFSIPNANKASVGITPALYDRRALDCTSTLPLINSLNNLAYHATSSARIRDILTVDGGIERLICILKDGRKTKNMMECWKWNLAFQCVVNIGIRGSEAVRTRVVEADMVPVIATMLENYIRSIDKAREKCEADSKRSVRHLSKHHSRASDLLFPGPGGLHRPVPPRIDIPGRTTVTAREVEVPEAPQASSPFTHSSPAERTTFGRGHHHHHHHRSQDIRIPVPPPPPSQITPLPTLATSAPEAVQTQDSFGVRPVRDVDRLPSILPTLRTELTSQPASPTTPSAPIQLQNHMPRAPVGAGRPTRRPSIRHQLSVSGVAAVSGVPDDAVSPDELPVDVSTEATVEPMVGIQAEIAMDVMDVMDDMVDTEALMEGRGSPMRLEQPVSDQPDDAVTMARSVIEGGSITNGINATPNMTAANFNMPQAQPHNLAPTVQMQLNPYARHIQERCSAAGFTSSMPRDEDVLMCLQLLAYVSKYCNLRSYFQQSHLVPKLKLPQWEVEFLDGDASSPQEPVKEEEYIEEYLQPDDFNIFPLVEKFTVRHHTHDMQYWAGVVMRNLCRKDDARGGIRQCAYYQCGRWEECARQFAKCRRCRRTKYCSKECQKSAWVFHRHWCVPAQEPSRS